jgi:argininosuccinate lyase
MKGLPLAYNSDLQEDKEALFDAADTARATLEVTTAMLPGLRFDGPKMRLASRGLLLATELADHLVERGLPFRDSHRVVGAVVRHAIAEKKTLEDFSLAELRQFSDRFDATVLKRLTPEAAIDRRKLPGGTARANVERRLRKIGV